MGYSGVRRGGKEWPTCQPRQRRPLERSPSRAVRDGLEGEPKATLGCVLTEAPPPAQVLGTQDRAGWGLGELGWGRARWSYLRPQQPRGARQASSSRLTLVRRKQKGSQRQQLHVHLRRTRLPSQGASPGCLWFPRARAAHCRTHLHTFWAVVPGGADVSRESLGGGRERGHPQGRGPHPEGVWPCIGQRTRAGAQRF